MLLEGLDLVYKKLSLLFTQKKKKKVIFIVISSYYDKASFHLIDDGIKVDFHKSWNGMGRFPFNAPRLIFFFFFHLHNLKTIDGLHMFY
jgi:hypothetical protein